MRLLRETFGKFSSLSPITRSAKNLEIGNLVSTAFGERHDVINLQMGVGVSAYGAEAIVSSEERVDFASRNSLTGISLSRATSLAMDAPRAANMIRVLGAPVVAALAFYFWLSGTVGALSSRESFEVFGLKTSLTKSLALYALSVAHQAQDGVTVLARFAGPVVRFTRRLGELSLFDRRPHSILLEGVL